MRKYLFILAAFIPAIASAAVKTQLVEYKQGGTTLEGFLAWDDAVQTKSPGVLVAHAWKGLDDFTREETTRLAQMGYVAFALDIYGKGVRPTDPAECGKQAGRYKGDRALLRARAAAGLKELRKNKFVDADRVAVIGFCFGGTTALELARSGAALKGTVTFHGGLSTPTPADAAKIKGKVLVLHGGDDPYVPKAEVDAFIDEMRNGKVDWALVHYGGAVHAFSEPGSGNDPSKGAAYNAQAAERSWKAMSNFFEEIFKTSAR